MKNNYEIRGDMTVIFLDRKDGTRLECLIDTADLPRVMEFPYKWNPHWDRHTKSFYAEGKTYNGRNSNGHYKREYFSLHRWIMQPPNGYEVDHINHDTLDNRRCNLRIVPRGANQQNYHRARTTSKSGIRGVRQTKSGKWLARYRRNGKWYHVGVFATAKEAEIAIKEARALAMPYSLDAYEKNKTGGVIL